AGAAATRREHVKATAGRKEAMRCDRPVFMDRCQVEIIGSHLCEVNHYITVMGERVRRERNGAAQKRGDTPADGKAPTEGQGKDFCRGVRGTAKSRARPAQAHARGG